MACDDLKQHFVHQLKSIKSSWGVRTHCSNVYAVYQVEKEYELHYDARSTFKKYQKADENQSSSEENNRVEGLPKREIPYS